MNPSLSVRPNQRVERNDVICYLFPFKTGTRVKRVGRPPWSRAGPPGPACRSLDPTSRRGRRLRTWADHGLRPTNLPRLYALTHLFLDLAWIVHLSQLPCLRLRLGFCEARQRWIEDTPIRRLRAERI